MTKSEGMAHTCSGHLIPCCHLDYIANSDPAYRELLKDKLKLSNNDSVEDILTSDEWLNFGRAVFKGLNEGINELQPVPIPSEPLTKIIGIIGT